MTTTTTALEIDPIAPNMTELRLEGVRVLFSYSTPVACHLTDPRAISDIALPGYYRTEKKWSPTTTRHISKWLDGSTASSEPQEFFDNLLNF